MKIGVSRCVNLLSPCTLPAELYKANSEAKVLWSQASRDPIGTSAGNDKTASISQTHYLRLDPPIC